MDTTSEILALRAAGTQQLATIAVMRKAHEMELATINMIEEGTRKAPPPPPPGLGRVVDKHA